MKVAFVFVMLPVVPFSDTYDKKCQRNTFENDVLSQHVTNACCFCMRADQRQNVLMSVNVDKRGHRVRALYCSSNVSVIMPQTNDNNLIYNLLYINNIFATVHSNPQFNL